MPKLTRPKATQLRADHAAGLTVAQCARKHLVSWTHAKRIVSGEAWVGRPRQPSATPAEAVREIRRRLAAGDKPDAIACDLSVSRTCVHKIGTGQRRKAA